MDNTKPLACSYNEQGYCKYCGRTKPPALASLGAWPTNTWFQKRLAEVRYAELSKVQS